MIPRVIPSLQVIGRKLVKTVGFRQPSYVGDPANTVRIFNELEVDELLILDIRPQDGPDLPLVAQLASECFMPLAYGGGIRCLAHAQTLFDCGIEKVVLGRAIWQDPDLVRSIAAAYGEQATMASIDVRRSRWPWSRQPRAAGSGRPLIDAIRLATECGCGEILLTGCAADGRFDGYDLEAIALASSATNVPIIASGGAGSIDHLRAAVLAGAAAVAVGSLSVFQGRQRAVLVGLPDRRELDRVLGEAIQTRQDPPR